MQQAIPLIALPALLLLLPPSAKRFTGYLTVFCAVPNEAYGTVHV